MTTPPELRYTSDHEWVRTGDTPTVGITDHAAGALGDIVYLDLPAVGDRVQAGEVCGEIESTKSVSDLYAPANGTVVAVNPDLDDDPSLVNKDPYGDGWLFRLDGDAVLGPTLDADAYDRLVEGEDDPEPPACR